MNLEWLDNYKNALITLKNQTIILNWNYTNDMRLP